MTRDHHEVVREIFRRWNAGERELETDLFEEGVRIESTLTGTVYEGRPGIERWMQEIDEQFDRWDIACEEILEAGSDRVLVLGSIRLRGRESGVEFDQPAAYLCDFRDGRISKFKTFQAHEAGRAAAGLA